VARLQIFPKVIESTFVRMWAGQDDVNGALANDLFDSWAVAVSDQEYLPIDFAASWTDHLVEALRQWQL
jgi:hypothetical protein